MHNVKLSKTIQPLRVATRPIKCTERVRAGAKPTVLYGEGGASYLAKRMMAIAMGELMARPEEHADPKPLSAADRMLICYGDSVRDEPGMSLSALRQFATQYLQNSISTIHILPFFPSSSDDG